MRALVDVLLGVVDWECERTGAVGTAELVPEALHRLLAAETDDGAISAYWELDNRVVVQGQLFGAAITLVPALLMALLANVGESARYWLMELLIQIAAGESHRSEVDQQLGTAARHAIGEGLWILYAQLADQSPRVRSTAVDLLGIVEPDSSRLAVVVRSQLGADPSEEVRHAISRLGA